ncbi:MAG: FKBP-type peptidyl-prolyl cis-trans isomerase [Myxococcota bacterium]
MLLALLACGSHDPSRADTRPAAATIARKSAPASVEGIEPVRSATGLVYYVLQEGTGPTPTAGQTVLVHYTGWLAKSGRKFDSSLDRGQPIAFPVQMGIVVKGWDEGIATMKVGEKRQLHVPSVLGYGDRGAGGVIPPNADLVFDVELVGLR